MQLRKMTGEDWQTFRDFRLSAMTSDDSLAFGDGYKQESERSEEGWRVRLDSVDRIHYGFFEGDRLVATVACIFYKDLSAWMLVGVYTLPEFRRQGLSEKLAEAVFEELKARGVERVILYVNTKQEPAVKLYKKLGFEIIDILKDHPMGDGKLHDEYKMEKVF